MEPIPRLSLNVFPLIVEFFNATIASFIVPLDSVSTIISSAVLLFAVLAVSERELRACVSV